MGVKGLTCSALASRGVLAQQLPTHTSAIKFVLFQVSIDELQQAAKLLVEALFIRSKYMAMSMQSFCSTTARKLKTVHEDFDTEAQYFHLKRHSIDDDLGRYSPSLECKVPSSISLT